MPFLVLLLAWLLTACETPPPKIHPKLLPPSTTTVDPTPSPDVPLPSSEASQEAGNFDFDPRNLPIIKVDPALLLRPQQLGQQVQGAINPIYPNWVLFKNGTYVVFDGQDPIFNMEKEALLLLEQYRPKTAEESYWEYNITELHQVEGWSVDGNGYGIYTYVYPNELVEIENLSMQKVAAFAKAKRALDEAQPQIIYTHTGSGLMPYSQ